MVTLQARPAAIEIDPAQTALVIVDMQNAFASKGGMFDLAGFDISGAPAAIEANQRLIHGCRAAGVQLVYLQYVYDAELRDGGGPEPPNYNKELGMVMMRDKPELAGKLLVEGTWDAAIIDELTPVPGDKVIIKTRYSGFCRTETEDYLRSQNISHLLFTGIATNVCVESTARDAYFAEFFPIVIEDAMNHSGPDFNRQAMLWNFENVFGWVTKSAHVLAALEAKANAA